MQTGLDHLVLGIDDLDRGIDWVEQRTGVRAIYGGAHPGRGTCNALLSLGPDRYLEIIAPDPQQTALAWFTRIRELKEPRLLTWAVHTSDLASLAENIVAAGFSISGPHDGRRSRPDGKILSWKLFHLQDNRDGLLPFFIEWGRGSVHPAVDAPAGCTLDRLRLQSPDVEQMARTCQLLDVAVDVEHGEHPRLLARITSKRGEFELTS